MKKIMCKSMLAASFAFFMVAGSAWALPVGNNSTGLQKILNDITVGGPSSVDANTDFLSDDVDSYWSVTGSGGSVATMIIEVAGFASTNIFGVYNNGNYVPLFNGPDTAGDQSVLSIKLDGSVYVNDVDTTVDFTGNSFGYYLDSSARDGGGRFHSDSSLNEDELDHMVAYQGTGDTIQIANIAAGTWTDNEFILAFEDLLEKPNFDYNDMVVIVESVEPIPEPATMLLFGAGLAGLSGVARRRRKM